METQNVKDTVRQIFTEYLTANGHRKTPERYAIPVSYTHLLDPQSYSGRLGLATLEQKEGKFREALEILNKMLAATPEAVSYTHLLRKIYKVTLGRKFPMLTNYAVTIPPGGRTDAFVQTVITWSYDEQVFRTRGLDADQTEAAIKATMKMLNLIEDEYEKSK